MSKDILQKARELCDELGEGFTPQIGVFHPVAIAEHWAVEADGGPFSAYYRSHANGAEISGSVRGTDPVRAVEKVKENLRSLIAEALPDLLTLKEKDLITEARDLYGDLAEEQHTDPYCDCLLCQTARTMKDLIALITGEAP